MNELLQRVRKRADISESAARAAINEVLEYLKGKLPGSTFGTVDNLLTEHEATNKPIDASLGFGEKLPSGDVTPH